LAEIETLKLKIREIESRTENKENTLKAVSARLAMALDLTPVGVRGDPGRNAEDFSMYVAHCEGNSYKEIAEKFGRSKGSVEKAVRFQAHMGEYVMVSRKDMEEARRQGSRDYYLWQSRMIACAEALLGQVGWKKVEPDWSQRTEAAWQLVRKLVKKEAQPARFDDAFEKEATWPNDE